MQSAWWSYIPAAKTFYCADVTFVNAFGNLKGSTQILVIIRDKLAKQVSAKSWVFIIAKTNLRSNLLRFSSFNFLCVCVCVCTFRSTFIYLDKRVKEKEGKAIQEKLSLKFLPRTRQAPTEWGVTVMDIHCPPLLGLINWQDVLQFLLWT